MTVLELVRFPAIGLPVSHAAGVGAGDTQDPSAQESRTRKRNCFRWFHLSENAPPKANKWREATYPGFSHCFLFYPLSFTYFPPPPAFCRKIKVIFVAWGRNVNMLSIWELGFCEIFPFLIIPQIKQMDQFTKILESLHIHNLKS